MAEFPRRILVWSFGPAIDLTQHIWDSKRFVWRLSRVQETGMNYWIAAMIGLVGGVASGLFGVGGGIIMVPAMIHFLGLPTKTAVGTSLAVIIPTTIVGSIKHFQMGNVHFPTVLSLAPTAVLGGFAGAWLTTHLSDLNLKRAFGAFIILVGVRLLFFK